MDTDVWCDCEGVGLSCPSWVCGIQMEESHSDRVAIKIHKPWFPTHWRKTLAGLVRGMMPRPTRSALQFEIMCHDAFGAPLPQRAPWVCTVFLSDMGFPIGAAGTRGDSSSESDGAVPCELWLGTRGTPQSFFLHRARGTSEVMVAQSDEIAFEMSLFYSTIGGSRGFPSPFHDFYAKVEFTFPSDAESFISTDSGNYWG